jgi:PKD repeat protein
MRRVTGGPVVPHGSATRAALAAALVIVALAVVGCGADSAPVSGSAASPGPVAAFTFSPASPSASQTVEFTDTTTGNPTSWSWNFGDGGTSALRNPTHVYEAAGTFMVTLVATSAQGFSAATNSVMVAATGARLSIVLGRPTDSSIAGSVLAAPGTEVYLEYGTEPGSYSGTTLTDAVSTAFPVAVSIRGLRANTRYYYRARYRSRGEEGYYADAERSFQTQRLSGSAFTFVVQADPHLDDNSSTDVYSQTLLNELADRPDFMFDLGDTSMAERCAVDGSSLCASPSPTSFDKVWARNTLMRSYFDLACHSVPLFMALGNHDGEAGWQDSATAGTLGAWSITARKALYLNPEPDAFYSGNTERSPAFGLLQNYYAFEWGDALFVVLDPFTYTTRKPAKDQDQDSWYWTLGAAQYQWLARTLAASRARFKFVFSHHLVGGNGSDARGGAAFGRLFEWGGRNVDGSWAFDRQRPGWSAPIHQLLVDNKVTAWFHGHDHLYAQETLDGVIYQEVPQPSLARYDMPDPGAGYGYLGTVGVNIFPSSGHLRVSVSTTEVRVEYVRSVAPADQTATRKNGSIVHAYTVR